MIPPGVAARAGELTSAAGKEAAGWLALGGLPDPVVTVRWRWSENLKARWLDERMFAFGAGTTLELTGFTEPTGPAGTPGTVQPVVLVKAVRTGLGLADELLTGVVRGAIEDGGGHMDWWPVIMPSHREAVAAHMAPLLRPGWGRERVEARRLAELVELGATTAEWAGASGEIPDITAIAARRNSSRFAGCCRRLRDLLARPQEAPGRRG